MMRIDTFIRGIFLRSAFWRRCHKMQRHGCRHAGCRWFDDRMQPSCRLCILSVPPTLERYFHLSIPVYGV